MSVVVPSKMNDVSPDPGIFKEIFGCSLTEYQKATKKKRKLSSTSEQLFETIFGCSFTKYQKASVGLGLEPISTNDGCVLTTKCQSETLSEIYSFLNVRDLVQLGTTNRAIGDAIQFDHAPRLARMTGTKECFLSQLQPELISQVYSFLEVGDLFQLSKTSKAIRNGIQYDHVLRLAMMNGNKNTKISCDRIIHLVSRGDIYTPSVMRLLRLVNGKRCELCQRRKVGRVSASFGVFGCWETCIGGEGRASVSAVMKINRDRPKWRPFVLPRHVFEDNRKGRDTTTHNKDRIAMYEAPSLVMIWRRRMQEAGGGELCGPVLSVKELDHALEKPWQRTLSKERQAADARNWYHTGLAGGRKNKKSDLLRAYMMIQKEISMNPKPKRTSKGRKRKRNT